VAWWVIVVGAAFAADPISSEIGAQIPPPSILLARQLELRAVEGGFQLRVITDATGEIPSRYRTLSWEEVLRELDQLKPETLVVLKADLDLTFTLRQKKQLNKIVSLRRLKLQ
jgi:hypothetical protein